MTVTTARIREIQGLLSGLTPTWTDTEHTAANGPPSAALDGVNLSGAIISYVSVENRKVPAYKTTEITAVADNSQTYTVTIGGVNSQITSDSDATVAEIINALATQVTSDANGATGTAVDTDGDGDADLLRVTGDSVSDYTISVSVGGGSAALSIDYEDSPTADYVVWGLLKSRGTWVKLATGTANDNAFETFTNTGGLSRIYVEVSSFTNSVTTAVGPSVDT